MTRITFKKYMEMMHEAEEKHGALFENEISEKDWNNPLIKDEDLPGLTLTGTWNSKSGVSMAP